MSVVFSDDDDVPTYEKALEKVHTSILSKRSSSQISELDDKENLFRSVFDNDPVSLRLLTEKSRSPGDVFIRPMIARSKLRDQYDFSVSKRQNCVSAKWFSGSRKSLTENSSLLTPRRNHRKRLRLKQLHDAGISNQSPQSDDDKEFMPERSRYDNETLRDLTVLTMTLRPRKELWSPEDDLPLAEHQLSALKNMLDKSDGPLNKDNQGGESFDGVLNQSTSISNSGSVLRGESVEIHDHSTSKKELWNAEDDLPLAKLQPHTLKNKLDKCDEPLNENIQERKSFGDVLNDSTSLSNSGCPVLNGESTEIYDHSTSKKGPPLSTKTNMLLVSPCRETGTIGKQRKSLQKPQRSKRSQLDDDYRGPDGDDLLLLEIKTRLRTLRSSRKPVS